ncbi:hypothetical protein BMF35_a0420 [Aurantiacibacter gangjinensis]|nr:hypothetical protein BMF35_a0420 [Aurantiacibacter gangjinensis]
MILFLPALPFGYVLIYPFHILTTWFHEMGHGLTALALGHGFKELVILPDGSGWASSRLAVDTSGLSHALIAMGGPLGPSAVGALLILASAARKYWRPTLFVLAAVIAVSTLIWVRSLTGWIVLPALAAGIALIAWRSRDSVQLFTLQFLGVLAALSMFRDWDYLFSESAVIGGNVILSDTGAMEAHLWLPHWVWASIIIGLSGWMIGASLKYALSRCF